MPPADRVTLIRRVTFDLTGLPPAPEDVDAFLADLAPGAYERLVDRLLASPAYGERWAQHWLDLARFAESDGFEFDAVRAEAWRYRDWVIDALNRDLPYDEFVRLQLAGDELRPGKRDAAVATGFALCGPDMPDINLQAERRDMVLSELTGTVGAVFLGLQIGCARCHDHKYDPVSQADFYRLRAFFEPVTLFEEHEFGRVLHEPAGVPSPSYLLVRGDFRRAGPEVQPGYPRIVNPSDEPVEVSDVPAKTSGRRTALARWLTRPDHLLTTRVIVNRLWQHHFGRGLVATPSDFGRMGDESTHPELLDWLATELVRRGWSLKAMHKLMVTSAAYRRASRPGAGVGSVERAENSLPHPAPRTPHPITHTPRWQQLVEADPENRLLGRMNRRRLEGEAIRDAMLAASNRLSSRRGGRGVMPPLPQELVGTLLKGQWEVSPDEQDHRRRSIYLFVRRNLRYPLFEAFDRPDTNASCARRSQSTIAPQALMLLNSELSLEAARDLAGYALRRASRDETAWITLCYRRALGRRPSAEELADARGFLSDGRERLAAGPREAADVALPEGVDSPPAAALVDFCLVLFNLNEFVYVD
jgi:hypothetical protein